MNNPFDNVPSSVDMPENTDKKTLSSLSSLVERIEAAVSREEVAAKNQEELAGAVFETFLDDDGSMKDFSHSAEIKSVLRQTEMRMDAKLERVENLVREIPTTIEARLCEDDRIRLDKNFQSWKDLFRLYFPSVIGFFVTAVICIGIGFIMMSSASNKKADYEKRIQELDRWHQENAEAISFGQFYKENYPKKYREWQTGRWQQDIIYRDSLLHAHSLNRLKRLLED